MPVPWFVLVPSPLVGASTWQPVAAALAQLGSPALVAELEPAGTAAGEEQGEAGVPFWRRHAAGAAKAVAAVPAGCPIILVGHSGAGALLPAIRLLSRRAVAGYLFVDAGIQAGGRSRLWPEDAPFARQLRPLLAAGGRWPEWSDAQLAPLVPDAARRGRLLAGLQPRGLRFWTEPIPVFAAWPDAPCAYLHWSPAYDEAAQQARDRGWRLRHVRAGHFQLLVEPDRVALDLLALSAALGIEFEATDADADTSPDGPAA